jgi:pilus assembly protein CpaD
MNARLPLILAGVSSLALGACSTVEPRLTEPVASAADLHHIDVSLSGSHMDLPVPAGMTQLDDKSHDTIAAFAAEYLRVGHGALIMSTPSGGANANAAGLMAQQTRLALVDAGVPYSAIAGGTYDASGRADAPITLSFARFEAQAPQCQPLWEQDLAHQSDNRPWPSFGCATQANLAAMIEDPHDLVDPRAETPRDGGRRAVVMDNYRAGRQTSADRSADERVSISNVAH